METESKAALDFYNAAEHTMGNLFSRWMDESQYEDINDYQKPLNPIAEKCGVKIVKMTKRPFGCIFAVDGKEFQLKINSKGYYEYRWIR